MSSIVSSSGNIRVGVIGGGSWGTALSILINRAGSKVTLCTRNENVIDSIVQRRTNDIYLPSLFIDPAISVSNKLGDGCRGDLVVIAVPSSCVRSVCIAISDQLETHVPVVIASKGIERGSLMLMSEVAESILPHNPIALLSGPNFADEAASGLPTATTIACAARAQWELLIYALGGKYFRPYLTDDVISVQIAGAVKNVIAIACGIAVGNNLGENARAALVTRGFAEMSRLALAKGGAYETLMGLSGLGDLILTCGSAKSRNMSFGIAIGQGKTQEEILSSRGRSVTEGLIAAQSVYKLAAKLDVDMPISAAVYRILYENAPMQQVISDMLERPFVAEAQQRQTLVS